MLSAIAARKAKKAKKAAQDEGKMGDERIETKPAGISTGRTSPLSPELELSSSSESEATPAQRKRKSKGENDSRKLRHKKTKRMTHGDIGRARYFEAEQPIEGFDDDDDMFPSEQPVFSLTGPRAYSPSQPVTQDDEKENGFVTEDPGPSRGFSPSRPVIDSSEDENEGQAHEPPQAKAQNRSSHITSIFTPRNFVPKLDINTFQLSAIEVEALRPSHSVPGSLLIMSPGDSLTFVGCAFVTLLHGNAALFGTHCRPSLQSYRVFSPRSSPLASIDALKSSAPIIDSESLLYCQTSSQTALPLRIQKTFDINSHTVVLIQPLRTGVEGLGKACRTFEGVFDVIPGMQDVIAEAALNVEGFHPVNVQPHPHPQLQPFFLPDSWNEALDTAIPSLESKAGTLDTEENSFVALIKGPKKCGKSTFARTLLNRLITRYRRVAFLECDIGQSEFTPGGMVSLHVISSPVFGPPFTHPTVPHRSHYIGNTTPRSSPSHYLTSIQELVQSYRMDIQYAYQETSSDEVFDEEKFPGEIDDRTDTFIPLVVNTQGWIKGLGGDLLRKIEQIVEPTDIFDLDPQTSMMPPQRLQHFPARLHAIRPILTSSLSAYYTAADYRILSILSYFFAAFTSRGREARHWTTELPLCARPPWEVNCKDAIDRIILVGAGFEDVVPQELENALNCAVIGLVCDEDLINPDPDPEAGENTLLWPYTQGSPTTSPTTSRCLGLGLIRGVDSATGRLQLLTPLPPSQLSKCRIFVKGELEMPVWGMLDYREDYSQGVAGVKWEKVPYLRMGGGELTVVGGTRRRVRKNLMRRAQM